MYSIAFNFYSQFRFEVCYLGNSAFEGFFFMSFGYRMEEVID